jgi:hypothetical protein
MQMSAQADIPATVAQLDALDGAAALPARDRAYCAQLRNSLTRPARVGVIGLPGSRLAPVRRALLAGLPAACLPQEADWPDRMPVEWRHGAEPLRTVTLSDGSRLTEAGSGPLPPGAIFAEVALPLEALKAMTVLCLPLDGADLASGRALAWAARRCEIAIWCVAAPEDLSDAIWQAAPDGMKNYAYLVAGTSAGAAAAGDDGQARLTAQKRRYGFDGAYAVGGPGQDGAASLATLARQLRADIDEARRADLDAVTLFLRRRGLPVPPDTAAAGGAADPATGGRETAPQPASPAREAQAARIARLSEPILYLKRRARGLADVLAWADADLDWPAEVLAHCSETAEGLRERAWDWPEDDPVTAALGGMIEDACDTAMLLQIEAGAPRAEDAAALMLQLRLAFERALEA